MDMARPARSALLFTLTLAFSVLTGCGSSGGGGQPSPGPLTGNTAVTLLASSTANDKLQKFNIGVQEVVLTSQSGKTVTLSVPQSFTEFIQLNETAEPLATTSIPQDVYTSAVAILSGAQFTCVELSSNVVTDGIFSYIGVPANQIKVVLASPITVSGGAMALRLDLQVAKSATYDHCSGMGLNPYSINPVFNLTPVHFAAQPDSVSNGRLTSLTGIVTALGATSSAGTSVALTSADGLSIPLNVSGSTMLQGIPTVSALATGEAVEVDAAFQLDGSLLVTRLQVLDANAAALTLERSVLEFVSSGGSILLQTLQQGQGALFTARSPLGSEYSSFGSASFQISGSASNLATLPFNPSFNAGTMVPGQHISLTSHASAVQSAPVYLAASTITLEPQTLDGTVTSVVSAGAFQVYTIRLANYDLFNNLAVQPMQANQIVDPLNVTVYVDANTHHLNTSALAVGSALRFNGLVFNDGGTLRMDCLQVDDGVAP